MLSKPDGTLYSRTIKVGHLKRTDILVYSTKSEKEIKVEVKSKQDKTWPYVKGISGEGALLVLVDFQHKQALDRPDFYVLTSKDWQAYLDHYVRGANDLKELRENIIPVWNDGQVGQGVEVKEVLEHKEAWAKLDSLLS